MGSWGFCGLHRRELKDISLIGVINPQEDRVPTSNSDPVSWASEQLVSLIELLAA